MPFELIFATVAVGGIAIYVLADGFDLGVGILYLLAPRDQDRAIMMASISPFWDGNETWLVLGGTLLLAAFPAGYYILLPAFYLPVCIMLGALILRGVAFEFRENAIAGRVIWDVAFAGGSILAVIMQGCILGGFIAGVPVTDHHFSGSPLGCFGVLGLICAAGLIGGYALLGAGWLIRKTDGSTQVFAREVGHAALLLAIGAMGVVSLWELLTEPAVVVRWFAWPWVLPQAVLPLAAGGTGWLIWRHLWGDDDRMVFALTALLFLFGFGGLLISLWPYIVPRTITIWQAAADRSSYCFLSVGVFVVLPVNVTYMVFSYRVFRGKVAGDQSETRPSHALQGRRAQCSESRLHFS
jgi:cytochrome d ubiquinol oxidase subunit II